MISNSLGHDGLMAIAREVAEMGPKDHGVNRNRYGTITARVKEARYEAGLHQKGTGDDCKLCWDMTKYVIRNKEAA